MSGAIGAMSGPLHGGAPARVLPMIEEVERSGDARAVVKDILDRKDKLMGFGHRVYRVRDPRADVLKTAIEAFAWDAQVGMRSTILGYSKEDRAKLDELLVVRVAAGL